MHNAHITGIFWTIRVFPSIFTPQKILNTLLVHIIREDIRNFFLEAEVNWASLQKLKHCENHNFYPLLGRKKFLEGGVT